jgi:hypothetical protein
MTSSSFARYFAPWKVQREREQHLAALRERDGDSCRRCRRPIRFDLPSGHERAPKIEAIGPISAEDPQSIENLCLCHSRCNASGNDNTAEVKERVQARFGGTGLAAE